MPEKVKRNLVEELVGKLKRAADDYPDLAWESHEKEGLVEKVKEPPADVLAEFNRVLRMALEHNASDIHYDPLEDRLMVRFRIDGFLFDMVEYPPESTNKLTTQIKVAADLDIAERRIPQDGRLEKKVGDRDISLRVSTLPVVYGEKVVLRILETSKQLMSIEELGFFPREFGIFSSAIKRPNGMVLVCGPTGSGKTTTLYSALNAINTRQKNIITIEDPVEYHINGINQSPINPVTGATFATVLRSVLRQDPDVILIGEIRDAETASIATKSALTGHLVFSTMHTNRSAMAVDRLYDLGIERSLIAAGLNLSMSQVLVRKICPECRETVAYDKKAIEGVDMGGAVPKGNAPSFSFSRGCEKCQFTGYKGRAGLFELFNVTEEIARNIFDGKNGSELELIAIERGMRTLKDMGFLLVNKGLTTPEEVLRVTTI